MEKRRWAYWRRQPEGPVLYEVVRENLATLLEDVFACVRRGDKRRVFAYVKGAPGAGDSGAPGLAHGMSEVGPSKRATLGRVVLKLKTAKRSRLCHAPEGSAA